MVRLSIVSRKSRAARAVRDVLLYRYALILPTLVALLAFVASFLWSGGSAAKSGFYEAAAQVIPVLLLALFVETGTRFGGLRPASETLHRHHGEGPVLADRLRAHQPISAEQAAEARSLLEAANRALAEIPEMSQQMANVSHSVQVSIKSVVALAALAEGTALYALGAEISTTFLLLATAMGIAAIGWLLLSLVLLSFRVKALPQNELSRTGIDRAFDLTSIP